MLAPRPSRIIVRAVVVAVAAVGLAVGAASVANADDAAQSIPVNSEAPAIFEWD